MVILDTSIIIDHLRQSPSTGKTLLMEIAEKYLKEELAVSVISVQELYEGRSTLDMEAEKVLLATISPLKIISYNYEIAKKAGELARDLDKPIELADAAIAATALVHGAELFTLNKKDFSRIPHLDLFEL